MSLNVIHLALDTMYNSVIPYKQVCMYIDAEERKSRYQELNTCRT